MWRLLLLVGAGYLREILASSVLTTHEIDAILYEHNEFRKSVQPTAADMEYMETWDNCGQQFLSHLADLCVYRAPLNTQVYRQLSVPRCPYKCQSRCADMIGKHVVTNLSSKDSVWNEKLAAIAQDWADQCVYTQNIRREERFKGPVGENIYFTLEKYRAGEETKRWFEEGQKYSYTTDTCTDKRCGHYTQVVWAKSREIGCGVKMCDILQGLGWRNCYVIVCDYSPRGNRAYQKPYTAGKPCSQCQDGNNTCYDSLCGNPNRPRRAEDAKTGVVASSILDLEAFNGEPLVMDQPEFDTHVPSPVITVC
ncbi:Peptidase inhibitor 16 [Branchiostoma belcheri]|nr:Peptidase inhibitor 16 [Branchiostoma belcheri]